MLMVRQYHVALQKRCSVILIAYDITAHDRIIYDIYDDRVTVLVIQAEEHYNDK